ncbi:MAG: tetratricopeptide repeat protein [Pseudomonadales bacterium]|jgi:tol-pal system protein YbgF|nr:tetratricopeptide repeat protein [Pseudomonadales bacterium]
MRYTVSALLLLWALAASAQVPGGGNNELVVNLYNQLQELQDEVLNLRGLVEQQGYQLQRLQTESRDRYLDLDNRLQALTSGATATAPLNAPAVTAPATPATGSAAGAATPRNAPVASATPAGSARAASSGVVAADPQALRLDEQETYRTALNLLLEENKPLDAAARFQSYIERFPSGRLFTNALYWQGEAFILVGRNQEAIDVFNRLLKEYPLDAKAPGAMLKAGVAYDRMNKRSTADGLWKDLQTRFPTATAEINAAQDYLRRR